MRSTRPTTRSTETPAERRAGLRSASPEQKSELGVSVTVRHTHHTDASDQVELKKGSRDSHTSRLRAGRREHGPVSRKAAAGRVCSHPPAPPRHRRPATQHASHTHTRHSIPHRTDHTSILHRTTSHVVRIVYRLSRTDRSPHHKTIPYLTSGRSTTCITAPLR